MTLPELQKQALHYQLAIALQLVQALLESLKREAHPKPKQRNLSQLRGIANSTITRIQTETVSYDDRSQHVESQYRHLKFCKK